MGKKIFSPSVKQSGQAPPKPNSGSAPKVKKGCGCGGRKK